MTGSVPMPLDLDFIIPIKKGWKWTVKWLNDDIEDIFELTWQKFWLTMIKPSQNTTIDFRIKSGEIERLRIER